MDDLYAYCDKMPFHNWVVRVCGNTYKDTCRWIWKMILSCMLNRTGNYMHSICTVNEKSKFSIFVYKSLIGYSANDYINCYTGMYTV